MSSLKNYAHMYTTHSLAVTYICFSFIDFLAWKWGKQEDIRSNNLQGYWVIQWDDECKAFNAVLASRNP